MGNNASGPRREGKDLAWLFIHVTIYSPQTQVDRRRTPVKTETQSGVNGTDQDKTTIKVITLRWEEKKNINWDQAEEESLQDPKWYKNHLWLLNVKEWMDDY